MWLFVSVEVLDGSVYVSVCVSECVCMRKSRYTCMGRAGGLSRCACGTAQRTDSTNSRNSS